MRWCHIVLCLGLVVSDVLTQSYVPKYLQQRYGKSMPGYGGGGVKAPGTKTFTKTKTKNVGGSSAVTTKFRGGCNVEPETPMNSGLYCAKYSGCKAKCVPNYQFPNGNTELYLQCIEGLWVVSMAEWDTIPGCEPICMPTCQNNGICVSPNQCNCPENFSGPQCQYENKPCLNYPSMPMNAKRSCRSTTCTITCMPDHKFPDGSSIATMMCKNGNWMPTKDNWVSVPDCQATCNPPCMNGGNCLSLNVCQCPQDYRGPQCQYPSSRCSAKTLQFNGGYNCSGNSQSFSCSVNCPEGIKFEFPPESKYTCTYESGSFQPSPIPQCVFPENMEIIPSGGPYNTLYNIGNNSFSPKTMSVNGNKITDNDVTFPEDVPKKTKKGKGKSKMQPENDNIHFIPMAGYHGKDGRYVIIEEKRPEPGTCFTWGGSHYKTFDGKVYPVNSGCAHTLVRDAVDNTFSVVVQNNPCTTDPSLCYRIIKIYMQDKEYVLKKSAKGIPIFVAPTKILPIPGQLPGMRVEMVAHYIVVSLDSVGAKIKWDGQKMVQVNVNEALWNRTSGLCGRFDGNQENDLEAKDGSIPKNVVTFASSWQVDNLEEPCTTTPTEVHACQESGIADSKSHDAADFCKQLLADKRFAPCLRVMDINILFDACRWDYCSCQSQNPSECACNTLMIYVKTCAFKGTAKIANWRDDKICPMKCTGGRMYMTCAPAGGQAVCGASVELFSDESTCEEGCYCPTGTVLHDGKCITKDQCPCRLRGKDYKSGQSVPKSCNTCTCQEGQWLCTQISCGARCSALGDPHYITFDGKRYDFMGQCSYYLLKTDNFSIEAENVACSGAISQAMNFPVSIAAGLPSCTKAVTIKIGGQSIKMKQNHELVVDGRDVTKLPYKSAAITVRTVSSIYLVAKLPNGVEVWWDGVSRAYVDVPASFKGQTQGLCGTFNDNQKDDFLTPENDIEPSAIAFANKWKTDEKCNDVPDKLLSHPCILNVQNKAIAEKYCGKIKADIFKICHSVIDPEPFYQDCMYDMCACEAKLEKCLCPMIGAYAEECAAKGVKVNWRGEVKVCGIACPTGQTYQVCGNPCTRTCNDIGNNPTCVRQCVEGCNCPEGETLDEHGECIPIGRCKCQFDGLDFMPGYLEVRPSTKGLQLCTCLNADWSCRSATPDDVKTHPQASDLKSKCDASKNFVFTTCESPEPVTCKNMHELDYFSAGVCHAGCECKDGYVLDTKSKTCVKPTECPCHHGGRSYKENSVVQSDCNTCKCKNGKWDCTDRQCSAECSVFGDSHFKTFDGKMYDYQGQCDYVLAKGVLSSDDTFDITIQDVPCGTLGVSCSKSLTIKIGSGPQQESITLTKDKKVRDGQIFKRFTVRNRDLFVIVEAADLGLIIHWDKGTRVFVKVDPRWKNKVKGLCGNYNDNENDDFQTPSGGIPEASAQIFGDSWKLQSYCPDAQDIRDTCDQRPDRRVWALKECGIMKSATFAACHSEIPVDNYMDRCVFDSCACDQGGDCECLCTAIAAYAQQCNNHGIPIKWRSQKLCPIQCDEACSNYSPCVSTCPVETCDNLLIQSPLTKLCKEDTCVEGCEPKPCPAGHVYSNSSLSECVPAAICKHVCLEIDGVTYYEGDKIEEDDCHSCYCSRGKKVCKGHTCAPVDSTTETVPVSHQLDEKPSCKSGWTEWINQDKVEGEASKSKQTTKLTDEEPLPDDIIMNNLKSKSRCNKDQIVDIQCRTAKTHKNFKETGMDVECSLERGLICKSEKGQRPCPDFEIRVMCKCDEDHTELPITTLIPCDSRRPNQDFPDDCHKFYQCAPGPDGTHGLVEKTCGKDMLYNPQSQICDWPANVMSIKPECEDQIISESEKTMKPDDTYSTESGSIIEPEGPQCPPGQVFDDCAIECDQLCLHYSYYVKEQGQCKGNVICEAGCVDDSKPRKCAPGMVWANNHTCVTINDCLCASHDGKPIKPGTVFKETDCMICQCWDNFYACDTSSCKESHDDEVVVTQKIEIYENTTDIIGLMTKPPVISTVTPPKECSPDMFLDLIQGDQPLPDEAFSASGMQSPSFAPHYSRIDSKVTEKSGGSWAPKKSDKNQWLQIDLGKMEPVYGVVIKGSPLYTEFVTSFKVLYSPKSEDDFSYVMDRTKEPQIFRGTLDGNTPVQHVFNEPIEAKLIRVNPQSWNSGISLRVELIGCGESKVTTPRYEVTGIGGKDMCFDAMGIDDGMMSDQQITVSSSYGPSNSKKDLKLSSLNGWRPITNSPSEWIEFDFLEPRNITGFVTKGGPNGWVTAFRVKYSKTGKDWNPILDEILNEKTFLGNFDESTPHTNNFDLPILAEFVKIMPVKWHKNIQLRLEMHGCYQPYPTVAIPVTTEVPSPCNNCPGTTSSELEVGACRCKPDLWWDGENCVSRSQCPCMVGHIPYSIGTVFEKEDCSQCICKLGGIAQCAPKTCEKCGNGLRSTVTSTCSCMCLPCDEGTTLCPTSNNCINSTSWCDGIIDCPDDEINCLTTTELPEITEQPISKVTVPDAQSQKCPKIDCPPGYKMVKKKPSKSERNHSYLSTMFSTYSRKIGKTSSYIPSKTKGGAKGYKNTMRRPVEIENKPLKDQPCPEYKCQSLKPPPDFPPQGKPCPPARCPPGFNPEFIDVDIKNKNKCPKYECTPTPAPDAVCNVTGRTFNTFDNTEYKYDICNHVLARDLENMEWDILLKKNCTKFCTRNLVIHHNDHTFVLHPDLTLEFDGYKYTIAQTKKIGSHSQFFSISRLGNTLLFVSNHYGFWAIWDDQGNVKVGVSSKLIEKVDGLCGYYNDIAGDDKRKPDGSESKTTADFGDSWALTSEPIICEPKACPIHIQNKAWEMCNEVKSQVLSPCANVIDIDTFVSRCLETTCACLEVSAMNSTAEDMCRCKTLESFVVDCMIANNDIELTDWRMLHDCPVNCEAPLVHHDCYKRRCEPTCTSITDPTACPKLSNVCFPGCYCPPGYVRKGNDCIKSSTCKDCECNVLPHLQYVTYDETNFTVNGNCVYVMSRDVLEKYHDEHQFQVLITNAPCRDNNEKMCVGKITILYQGHKIHVFYDVVRNKLKLMVDAERIDDFEEIADFAKVRQTKSKHFKILLFKIQIEVSVYFPSLGVSVKAPSHKYGGKLEGLCGDCNKDPDNDMRTPAGTLAKDVEELGPSWLYDKLPGMTKETCANKPAEICEEYPVDQDPCVQLVDIDKYGQCHPLLDPGMFIEWCKKDSCGGHQERACAAISSYARECMSNGFCIHWHTDLCPAKPCDEGQDYDDCGPSCTKTCEHVLHPEMVKKCVNVPTDGCFCPEGKVLLNGTCVTEKMCQVCDEEGHHSGDKWQKDACTNCECVGTSLKCETQHCPAVDTVCEQGFTAVKLQKEATDCCEKFICVPGATVSPTCEPPQKLNCAPGQVMKLDTKPNGCQQFICQCKPPEQCDRIDLSRDENTEDGMVKEVDDTGCCPVVKNVCKPETCSKPPKCPEFHKIKETEQPDKCCSVFTCEPPQKCIVDLVYTADEEGGERPRNIYETQTVTKEVDEQWKDGPCRDCQCYGSNTTGYHSVCSFQECPPITSSPDFTEYELITDPIHGKCCPDIKRDGCKHDGKVYNVGEKWFATDDYCTKMQCVETTSYGIQKLTQVTSCDETCDLGFEYKPASKESKECCGSCKAISCVCDGIVRNVGEEWSSPDFCTKFMCLNLNGSMQVQSVKVVCPTIEEDQLNEFMYEFIPVEGECCKRHKMTACLADNEIHKVGETWPSPDGNKCKTVKCIEKDHRELTKVESIETCNKDCPKGWDYFESQTDCCGDCEQIACVVGEEMKRPGENWTSPDNCTTFSCEKILDQFTVNSFKESCPNIDDCAEENIYEKGCCKYCNMTAQAQGQCMPEEINSAKSIGIITAERQPHGMCKNEDPLVGFTECVGTCHSSTFFNIKKGQHDSVCSCCQATEFSPLLVELTCEDGYKFNKQVPVPKTCSCEGCGSSNLTKAPVSGVKTG